MAEHPILFSGPMVRAILDDRKTMTRRIVKNAPSWAKEWGYTCFTGPGCISARGPVVDDNGEGNYGEKSVKSPYGLKGDRLWVRETWGDADGYYQDHENEVPFVTCYCADLSALSHTDPPTPVPAYDIATWNWSKQKWRPSIHMPRWASRLTLEVTSVRVERLQDISEEDAKAEGVTPMGPGLSDDQHIIGGDERTHGTHPHTLAFACLWDEINGERASWLSNPWVWVVSFQRVTDA